MQLLVIYTTSGVYLSSRSDLSWQDCQDRWTDFQTALGPWDADEVVEYLDAEYPDLCPAAAEQVQQLRETLEPEIRLSFRG